MSKKPMRIGIRMGGKEEVVARYWLEEGILRYIRYIRYILLDGGCSRMFVLHDYTHTLFTHSTLISLINIRLGI